MLLGTLQDSAVCDSLQRIERFVSYQSELKDRNEHNNREKYYRVFSGKYLSNRSYDQTFT